MRNASVGVCVAVLALVAGCASQQTIDEPARGLAAQDAAKSGAETRDNVPLREAAPDPVELRIERAGWIRVDVPDEMPAAAMLRRRATDFEAVVMAFSTNSVTFKMPATQIEKLLKEIENTEKWEIDEFDFSAWDRTGEYWSLEARIESTAAVRARMLELLKRADDIDMLLKLESRLEGVQQKLDQLEGTKRDIGLKAGRVEVRITFD
jgi:hypothetical protein